MESHFTRIAFIYYLLIILLLIYTATCNNTENEAVSCCENDGSCYAGTKQFQVELCTNNTWEALCNTSTHAYYHYPTQDQCKFSTNILYFPLEPSTVIMLISVVNNNDSGTPGNLSVSLNMADPYNVTLNWSQPLRNCSISCCPAPYNKIDCIHTDECDYYANSARSAIVTGLTPYTSYECCVWAVHNNRRGPSSCQCVQTAEAGIILWMVLCIC